jgi:hypothetical protein
MTRNGVCEDRSEKLDRAVVTGGLSNLNWTSK